MATRGVMQLQRIHIRYCDWGGSSQGMRDFIGRELVAFAKAVPHCEIITEVRRNRHPIIRADYLTGIPKTLGVKNEAPSAIRDFLHRLRTTTGRKQRRFDKPVVSRLPSVQGAWDPEVAYQAMRTTVRHL
ncbi:thioredoxin-like protein [Tribonema minus]|uniref:Large ribosomal subunit protein mL43 n=1 Tax=Tribonema minus TaxID=303371 RepID=A0A835ZEX9_9STRA|nr:thioredoxin-like protein [Tribonema minus]